MEQIVASVWEFLGDSAAEIIALCALFFTAYQAHATRSHNKLSVKPHLTIFTTRNREPGKALLSAKLMNNGLGPAVIKSYQFFLDGEPLSLKSSKEAETLLKEMLKSKKVLTTSATTLAAGYAIPEKESKDIAVASFVLERDNDFEEVEAILGKIDLLIEYESVYGDQFTLDSRKKRKMT